MKRSAKNSIINVLRAFCLLISAACLTACSAAGAGGPSGSRDLTDVSGGIRSEQVGSEASSGKEASSSPAGSAADPGKAAAEGNEPTFPEDAESAAVGAGMDIHAALSEEYAGTVPEFVFLYAENQSYDYPTTQGAYRFVRMVHEQIGRAHV